MREPDFGGMRPQKTPQPEQEQFSQDQPLKLSSRRARDVYLTLLREQKVEPVVLLSGASGAGKSFVKNILKEQGTIEGVRLISRPRRECDPETDVSWDPTDQESSPPLLFSYTKHGHHYAFPETDFLAQLTSSKGISFVAGDLSKMNPLREAFANNLPLLPVVALRVDVPQDVVSYRLREKRSQAFQGEAEDRIRANALLERWEGKQLGVLGNLFDVHTVINLSEEEHKALGYSDSQVKPLTPELIAELMEEFRARAKDKSRALAIDLGTKRELREDSPNIPTEVCSTLKEVLAPAAKEHQATIALKGGLATAIYLEDAYYNGPIERHFTSHSDVEFFHNGQKPRKFPRRPVSPDIDWTMPTSEREAQTKLLNDISSSPAEFRTYREKPIFHSTKARGEYSHPDGPVVELDAIEISRVKPKRSQFCFDFEYDGYADFLRRPVQVESDEPVYLVPPEILIGEKLTAARGASLQKLDLYDAAGLLSTQNLDFTTIQRMIESQSFQPELDDYYLPELSDSKVEVAERLQEAGITDPLLKKLVTERVLFGIPDPGKSWLDNIGESVYLSFEWSADTLKRVSMVQSLLDGLTKIEAEKDRAQPLLPGKVRMTEVFGDECLQAAVDSLREFLYYYAEYQVGRTDITISRSK